MILNRNIAAELGPTIYAFNESLDAILNLWASSPSVRIFLKRHSQTIKYRDLRPVRRECIRLSRKSVARSKYGGVNRVSRPWALSCQGR